MLSKATTLWLLAVLLPFSKCHPWFGYLNRTDPTVPVIYKMFEPVWDESKNNELSEPLYVKRCAYLSHCFSIFTLTFFLARTEIRMQQPLLFTLLGISTEILDNVTIQRTALMLLM